MKNILSLLQNRTPESGVFFCIYLGGTGFGTVLHGFIKPVKRQSLPQIIRVFHTVQKVVETDIGYVPGLKVFFGQICCGAAG